MFMPFIYCRLLYQLMFWFVDKILSKKAEDINVKNWSEKREPLLFLNANNNIWTPNSNINLFRASFDDIYSSSPLRNSRYLSYDDKTKHN